MPFNKLKKYPELLDIAFMSDKDRRISLREIFDRDIADNPNFAFRNKRIYPLKTDGLIDMDREFIHLTTEEADIEEEDGKIVKHRVFDIHRSRRLHWIKPHIEEVIEDKVVVFSVLERDVKARKNVVKTYIYNKSEKYVIVLQAQHGNTSAYFLLTAYYLNREYGEKAILKKYRKRLPDIH
ncbi:MAG: hypothetical protein HDS65_02195 [Bacteroidales bacterium]|nr:hypothetical protein [Bacteroidales bacterium]